MVSCTIKKCSTGLCKRERWCNHSGAAVSIGARTSIAHRSIVHRPWFIGHAKTEASVFGYNLTPDALAEFELDDCMESRVKIISENIHDE